VKTQRLVAVFVGALLTWGNYVAFKNYFPFHQPLVFGAFALLVAVMQLSLVLGLAAFFRVLRQGLSRGRDNLLLPSRAAATLVDAGLALLLSMVTMPVANALAGYKPGLVVSVIIGTCSMLLKDSPARGSVGKRLLGIRVEGLDGGPCGVLSSFVRNVPVTVFVLLEVLQADANLRTNLGINMLYWFVIAVLIVDFIVLWRTGSRMMDAVLGLRILKVTKGERGRVSTFHK